MKRYRWTAAIEARRAIGRGPGWPWLGLLVLTLAACPEQPYRVCDSAVCQFGYECSQGGDFCVPHDGCGNGRRDPGEACDDGNRSSGDGCRDDCRSDERCGNGIIDVWESCDDGNRMPDDGCSRSCRLEGCGNGEDDLGEVCDDGNTRDGDGCSADCLSLETCGNGYIDIAKAESCDDGDTENDDGCSASCRDENCGNGVIDSREHCDDGNTKGGDGCSADCKSDEGCGNGIVDFSIGEQCDDGNAANGDGCNADCRRWTCGNGVIDQGEACDYGDTASGDGCNADCLYEAKCGNERLDPGEMCDPALGGPCNDDCTSDLSCRNGYYDSGEECDDGGNSQFCDSDCTRVSCGDGIRNEAAGETCDGLEAVAENEPNEDGSPQISGSSEGNDFSTMNANGPYEADTTIVANLDPAGDEDVFAVKNRGPGTVRVRFETHDMAAGLGVRCQAMDPVLCIRDAQGNLVSCWDDDLDRGLCSTVEHDILPDETVYAYVLDYHDDHPIPTPGYALVIDFL